VVQAAEREQKPRSSDALAANDIFSRRSLSGDHVAASVVIFRGEDMLNFCRLD
jgi:hypothetical protein